jgi:LuxR family maltose regulon positive regulatory protein
MVDPAMPVLGTKLHVPSVRAAVVDRPRLRERAARLPPLTLVSASAGFGKTTLAAGWFAGGDRTGWVSLDRRDSEPTTFWSYVVAALDRVEAGVGAGAEAILRQAGAIETAVATLINDVDALEGEIVLVLDDYHLVDSPEVHESVAFLLEHLPPQLRLVLLTRADPPLPLATLRARGDLLEIRAADLRFTGDEVSAYLNGAMGLELTPDDLERLEARTEGWVAALQLAALSLQGREDAAEFVAGFSGDDRFVLDYLVGEVLDRQTDDVRSFLLDTSVLSRLTGDLCDAVTGNAHGRAVLEQLERANLFLVPLDDHRSWYRYHHLFADVLHARLHHEQPGRSTELHLRASDWLAANGEPAEAVAHALAASDHERTARLIELATPAMRQQRREAELRAWLEALPHELLADRPTLAAHLVGARMGTGDAEGCQALLDLAEGRLQREPPPPMADPIAAARVPAEIAMYRSGLALLAGDATGTIEHATIALQRFELDDHYGRGAGSALVGLALWRMGDLAAAEEHYQQSIDAFLASGYYADVLGCSVALADLQLAQGRLAAAERTYAAGLRLAEAHGGLRGVADMHIGTAEVLLERHRLEAAASHLRAAKDAGDAAGLPQSAYRWPLEAARLQQDLGDLDGALELLDEAAPRYDTDFSPPVRPVLAWRARVQVARGDLEDAQRWAAERGLSADDESGYLTEFEHLTQARVLLATGAADDAHRLLARVADAARAGGRIANETDALVQLSAARAAMGHQDEAKATMRSALALAEPHGHVRPFLGSSLDLVRAIDDATPAGRHAAYVLAVAGGGPGPAPRARSRPSLVDELSPRELDVLRLLRSDLSGPDIARELHVSLNTFRTHTKSIYAKLGATNRREALTRAADLGL